MEHTLPTRQIEHDQWEAEDPGPGRNAGDPQHNVNPHNLMSPMVAADPQITPEQVSQARGSRLVSSQKLAFGFRENEPYKMAVKMKNMHVDWTEDEATSDDALESKWEFRVKLGLDNSMIAWEHSRLKAGDYDLSHMDFAFRNMKSDDDKLISDVTGEDWDFWSANDPLPRVYKEWEKGTDLWGSGSRDDPNAALGDHTHGPVENAEMKYSLTYNIRVWSKPEEQIFRSICAD